MTIATIDDMRFGAADRSARLSHLLPHERAFRGVGLLMLALMAPTTFALMVDERTIHGVGIWVKPLKFQFALAVYFLTLAFFARWVPRQVRERRWYGVYSLMLVAAAVIEIVWVAGASAIGTSSHFNQSAVYPLMGIAAVLITSASAVYAWQIARNRDLLLPAAFRESVVWGLALVLPLTLLTAGAMSGMGSHHVGGSATDAGGLAVMGWSREVGDLRVAHFFATHAMHFIPAFGLVSVWLLGAQRVWPVRIVALLFVGLVVLTFVQALAGRPFPG